MTPSKSREKASLLIVDDDPLIVESLQYFLGKDFNVLTASNREEAVALLRSHTPSPTLALIDLGLPPVPELPNEGFKLISELLAHSSQIKILVLSGQNEELSARRARALGALEFVPKPCSPEYLRELLLKTLQIDESSPSQPKDQNLPLIIGESPAIQKLKQQIAQYAPAIFPTLIEGESGSGKEVMAHALHQLSPREDKPFLALNCAAISPNLVEATLFGYVKGSFTGATNTTSGYFEDAGTGTLFLDEIGELPIDFQAKLLRVLENGEYQRIGETLTRKSKSRIIAATNRDLKKEVKLGKFRTDLYHRLSVFTITAPPLRDLGNDRLILFDYFQDYYTNESQSQRVRLSEEVRTRWLEYNFPGNVRELKNIVIRLITKYPGHTINLKELEAELDQNEMTENFYENNLPVPSVEKAKTQLSRGAFNLMDALRNYEQIYINAALEMSQGSVSQAAKLLGINRTTLYSRMENIETKNRD